MTGVGDRAAKRMRYIAWALGMIWAGSCTLCAGFLFWFAWAIYPCFDCYPKPPRDEALRAVLLEGWRSVASLLLIGGGGAVLLVSLLPKAVKRLRELWGTKRMRDRARALALIWAGSYTLCAAFLFLLDWGFHPWMGPYPGPPAVLRAVILEGWRFYASLLLIGWGGAALLVYLLPILASWWRSRRAGSPQNR